MATKHNSGQQNTYLQAKQTRQVATREVQTKQTSCSSSTITKAKTSLLTISMINISLVRLPQRDEVTEGQGRRDGPVARNGTHQYVKWATCPSRSSDWFKLWRGRGWALGRHMCMIGRQLCVAHSQRCSTALVRSRARTSRLDFCAHPVCNQAPQCDIHQHKEVSADASDRGCEGRTHCLK